MIKLILYTRKQYSHAVDKVEELIPITVEGTLH